MSSSSIKLLAVFLAVVLIIAGGTISAIIGDNGGKSEEVAIVTEKENKNAEEIKVVEKAPEKEQQKSEKKDENIKIEETNDLEEVYLEYIKNNLDTFESAIMLCDLNDDKIPELISAKNPDYEKVVLEFHAYENGKLLRKETEQPVYAGWFLTTGISHHSPLENFGLYENRNSGEKNVVSTATWLPEAAGIYAVSYNGKNVSLKFEQLLSEDERAKFVDTVMKNYQLSDDEIYMAQITEGSFDADSAEKSFRKIYNEYKNGIKSYSYAEIPGNEFFCTIRNVNLDKNEIELYPLSTITYEQYQTAMNSENKTIEIEGKTYILGGVETENGMSIVESGSENITYFDPPTPEHPETVLGALENKLVKVTINENTKIIYSEHYIDENGELWGGKGEGVGVVNTPSVYFENFAQNYTGSHYKATVENGVLTELYIEYRP